MNFNSSSNNLVSKPRLSLWERIYRKINPIPLRNQIVNTLIKLNVQKNRLSHGRAELEAIARNIYNWISEAKVSSDWNKVKIYVNEYVEIRKICKLIVEAELVLEATLLRLETVKSFSDIAAAITPLQTVVNTLRSEFADSIPKLSAEFSGVFESIKSIMIEIFETSSNLYRETIIDEAEKILKAASIAADQRINEKLPEIPIQELVPEKVES
ncbi:MAG: hypothetical protein QXY40_01400 [Candidatus Methanomethylicia archaeon]